MDQPGAPPAQPEIPSPEELAALDEEQLQRLVQSLGELERGIREQMAPFQRQLTRLAQDSALLATESRRRERQRHLQQRRQVRDQVKEGEAPSLAQLLAMPEPPSFGEPPLAELSFLLGTGGEVALGYPGSQSPSLQMTDGKAVATVTSLGQARELYRQGWECGVPARRGVRVHTPGTRLEKLLSDEECFVRPKKG